MDISLIFQDLPHYTFTQFSCAWGLYSFIAFILFRYERALMAMPWAALWIVATPARPVLEDTALMVACYILTDLVYRTALRIFTRQKGEIRC